MISICGGLNEEDIHMGTVVFHVFVFVLGINLLKQRNLEL